MLLRTFPAICQTNAAPSFAASRFISLNAARCDHRGNITEEDKALEKDDHSPAKKVVYPTRTVHPRVLSHPLIPEENPFQKTISGLKHDFDSVSSLRKGQRRQPPMSSTDVLVIGGGVVGSSIAYHLVQRTGPGLNVTVVEKDPPELSSSFKVEKSGLFQQLTMKPSVEMALYAADFYRQLSRTHTDPDLPIGMNIDFLPNNSLRLASDEEGVILDELSEMYKEVGWKHQMLSPSMLKQRFPWMNIEGVGAGCLGFQKEGIYNQLKALAAMRTWAKKDKVDFLQGRVLGFEFVDQTDFRSTPDEVTQFLSPRRVVIQLPNGDLIKKEFGYVIIAAGSAIHDVMEFLNVSGNMERLPIKTQEGLAYEIWCPDGPGIEMPMVMEANGLRFRKCDVVNSYSVWDGINFEDKAAEEKIDVGNSIFWEKLFPQLLHRVPSFRDAKLISSQAGRIDRCTWDDNVLIGPLPSFYNVLIATGFGNHEFLYAPAAGVGIADLILDRDFTKIDLSCFRLERIESNIKLNQLTSYV